jgi:hypothetical protein
LSIVAPFCSVIGPVPASTTLPWTRSVRWFKMPVLAPLLVSVSPATTSVTPMPACVPADQVTAPFTRHVPAPSSVPPDCKTPSLRVAVALVATSKVPKLKSTVAPAAAPKLPLCEPAPSPPWRSSVAAVAVTEPELTSSAPITDAVVPPLLVSVPAFRNRSAAPREVAFRSASLCRSKVAPARLSIVPPFRVIPTAPSTTTLPWTRSVRVFKMAVVLPLFVSVPVPATSVTPVPACVPPDQVTAPLTSHVPAPSSVPPDCSTPSLRVAVIAVATSKVPKLNSTLPVPMVPVKLPLCEPTPSPPCRSNGPDVRLVAVTEPELTSSTPITDAAVPPLLLSVPAFRNRSAAPPAVAFKSASLCRSKVAPARLSIVPPFRVIPVIPLTTTLPSTRSVRADRVAVLPPLLVSVAVGAIRVCPEPCCVPLSHA